METEFKVGDYITLNRSYYPVIPVRVYVVVSVEVCKAPFIYQIQDTRTSYNGTINTSGKGYRLLTEAEKLLFMKDGQWTYK